MAVRVGIIGVGRWCKEVHIPNLLATGGTRVTALCSRSEENRRAGAALLPEPPALFGHAEQLIDCPQVDAVLVCTPNVLHAPLTVRALRAGKHVLCEKPLALSAAEAQQVAQTAAAAGRVLAVGLELRCSDVVMAARRAIVEGRIGAPLMATARFWRGWGGLTHGWRARPEASGGEYAELFCHTADLLAALVGEAPQRVCARAAAADGRLHRECTWVMMDYPCGAVGMGSLSLRAPGADGGREHPFEVMGEEGRLVGAIWAGRLELHRPGAEQPEDLSPERDPAVPVHGFPGSLEATREFVDCCTGRAEPPRAGLQAGLAAARTVEAIEKSLATGLPEATG